MHGYRSEEPARPAGWFKSTRSAAACTCVEVRFLPDAVQIRDSKQISAATGENVSDIITLPLSEWPQFLRHVTHDAPNPSPLLLRPANDSGAMALRCEATGAELIYDADEWDAFHDGVLDGEFDPPKATRH